MTHAHQSPSSGSNTAPIGPPPIVVVKSAASTTFSYANGILVGVRLLIVAPAIMAGMFILSGLARVRGFSTGIWMALAVNIMIIAIVCGVVITRRRRDWRTDRIFHNESIKDGDARDPAKIVRGALLEVGGLCRLHCCTLRPLPKWRGRFQQLLGEAGLPSAIVIVQAELIDKLRALPVDGVFVEQERLLAEMRRGSGTFWILAVLLIYSMWVVANAALGGDWIIAALVAAAGAVVASQILKSWGIHLSQAGAPVVGMGVFSDRKGRRWTVRDSVAYLYPWKAGFQSSIILALLGPDGYHAMQFHGLDDPALRMFWQRWMHPHPRPDLVQ